MGSVVRFASINTKIDAMAANFLTKDELSNLISTKSFSEALTYLANNTNYGHFLRKYDISKVHRGDLEEILCKNYINNFSKLRYFLSSSYKELFKVFFMRFEMEDLKTILRSKYTHYYEEFEIKNLVYKCNMSTFNYDNLIRSRTVEEAIEALKGTVYYKHIHRVADKTKEEGLFIVETALDFEYYVQLRKVLGKLNKEDSDIIRKYEGIQADIKNVQWIYRGIRFYKLSGEEILGYTIYDGYHLNKNDLKDLCDSKNLDDFLDKVIKTPYSILFEKAKEEGYLLEREALNYLKTEYKKLYKVKSFNISHLISYLDLSFIELKDIISIIESKRYNVGEQDILKYITEL